MSDWYKYGDKVYIQLVLRVERIFRKQRLQLRFDELNVVSSRDVADKIYTQLIALNRTAYEHICSWIWEDELLEAQSALEAQQKAETESKPKSESKKPETVTRLPAEWKQPVDTKYPANAKPPAELKPLTDKEVKDIVDEYLKSIDPVTKTVPEHDMERYRDKFFESTAIDADKHKRTEWEEDFKRAERIWDRFSQQGLIDLETIVRKKADEAAGVEYVQWHTEGDERVCSDCDPLDGKIFPIDKVPDKPHINCRCWWTPVKGYNGHKAFD